MDDRIVAEFGDGYDVRVIASRYGLTVDQIYAVVHREVGQVDQPYPHPEFGPEHGYQPPQGLRDDVIVADYGAGHDVEAIARQHGISVERVYEIVRGVLGDNPWPPAPDR
jgi:Mor family transcriptional regulator